ncbi:hypothetical protein SCHPADRAFT_893876 [Schizopora paradoxa]|uniref:RRM domain-containing protein n=1 Tax=Schizopora paradoxa TaxID=27342 RepID=A0A0H2RAN0_9AGAM|nr:hypothetical protein SCHPADRAFT_893876 [Schizopora paradoxa]
MSRYEHAEGSVATAHLSDTRSGHGYGSSLTPLAIPDRRPSQIGFTSLSDEHRRIYAAQFEEYARAGPQARGGVGNGVGGSNHGADWYHDVDEFWTGPTGTSSSPPDGSTGANRDSGSASRVASNSPGVGGSTVSSSSTTTTTTAPTSAGTYTPRGTPQYATTNGGGVTSPLSYSQVYDFNALRSELPLLQPPPTSVIPLAPVSHSTLPPQSRGDSTGYSPAPSQSPVYSKSSSRSTLWWGELEPWMDEEYAKQVCSLMGWDSVTVKIPHTPTDPVTGQQPNNPGYCFLTFPTSQQAAAVFAQINRSPNDTPVNMPNSTKPFVLNWASSPTPSPATATFNQAATGVGAALPNQQKEYSIFVGDLAPETSNSDLVAVFRNPVLGLRNDRAPKFIRPFYSCKSAKIMLDPVTGVSRGYGFVRFTDEADQQRALIEMHGLYCLSRPMRISPATAKFKTPQGGTDNGFGGVTASSSASSIGSSSSLPSLTASTTASSVASNNFQPNGAPPITSLDTLAQLIAKANDNTKQVGQQVPSITAPLVADKQMLDESWKHQAQARAILGNLIGPNGEQLTSTDPYNTTVFVGGLSPLISEETLRTFFAPFGDIHYVKVPTGKHCGFVQFVRKADAERAIERMQGFPIGGSRIRLSWGRSQYKAAQAAAQAAAHAHAQAMQSVPLSLSQEQAFEMLSKFGFGHSGANDQMGYGGADDGKVAASVMKSDEERLLAGYSESYAGQLLDKGSYGFESQSHPIPGFSPFSPDPNYLTGLAAERNNATSPRYATAPGSERFTSTKTTAGENGRTSTPSSKQGYQNDDSFGFAVGKPQHFQLNRVAGRHADGSSSRPTSSQASSSEKEHSAISDFHGTVAALDLDGNRSPGMKMEGTSALPFRTSLGSPKA